MYLNNLNNHFRETGDRVERTQGWRWGILGLIRAQPAGGSGLALEHLPSLILGTDRVGNSPNTPFWPPSQLDLYFSLAISLRKFMISEQINKYAGANLLFQKPKVNPFLMVTVLKIVTKLFCFACTNFKTYDMKVWKNLDRHCLEKFKMLCEDTG